MRLTAPVTTSAIALATALAMTAPAGAAQRHKRTHAETGPLIMSGTMVPASSARRARTAEICKPVTIKRRPFASLFTAR